MAALSSPQHVAVGEKPHNIADVILTNPKQSYASKLQQKQDAATISKLDLCPVNFVHGEPTVEFTMEEINEFTREEGLHQAVVMKFSYGKPEIQEIRRVFSMQFDVQGQCNIGQIDYRHLLVRFDLYTDFVQFLSRSTGYIKVKDEEYFFRTFPWTFSFNPKEETTMAVVWISFPGLPPNLFAKKSLLSIASVAGKVLAVDKATQDRTRPSTARVKVLLDLLGNHPYKVKLRIVDKSTGKSLVFYQEIVYDNLPSYCCNCKHQGHDERACRFLKGKTGEDAIAKKVNDTSGVAGNNFEQLQGDARIFLNAKRASQGVGDIPSQDVNKEKELVHSTEDNIATGNTVAATDPTHNRAEVHDRATTVHNQVGQLMVTANGIAISTAPKVSDPVISIEEGINIPPKSARDPSVTNVVNHLQSDAEINAEGNGKQLDDRTDAAGDTNIVQTVAPQLVHKHVFQQKFIHSERQEVGEVHNHTDNNAVSDIVLEAQPLVGVTKIPIEKTSIKNTQIIFGTVEKEATDRRRSQLKQSTVCQFSDEVYAAQVLNDENARNMGMNLEKNNGNLVENDKAGDTNKNQGDWNIVTNRKTAGKKQDAPQYQKQITTMTNSNAFESLAEIEVNKLESNIQTREMVCKQIVPCNAAGQQDKTHANMVMTAEDRVPKFSDLEELNIMKHHDIPTVQLSSSHIQQIIKDTQKDMIQSKLVKFFKPMVMLNTSIQDVPSQSLDSCGEFGGELVVSTDNNQDWKGTTSNSKSWADQSGDEEEEGFSSTEEEGDESDECEEDESDECEEDMASAVSPSTPKMGSNSEFQSNSKLNAKAPHFVPKAGGQQVTQDGQDRQQQHSGNLHDHEIKNAENGMQQSPTGQTNPNAMQQHIVQTTASSSARNQPRRGLPRFRNTYRAGEVPIQCCDTQSAIETTNEYIARVSEETVVRQLPMRVAKQKQVVSNTSKNPNRYKK